jgi:hypothetical protein
MSCSTRKRKIKAWSAQVPDQRRAAPEGCREETDSRKLERLVPMPHEAVGVSKKERKAGAR